MSSAIAQPAAEPSRPGRARLLKGLIWGFCLLLVAGIWWFVIAQIAVRARARRSTTPSARTSTARSPSSNMSGARSRRRDLVTRYVGGRFARGDAGAEFAGTPDRPARITGNVARKRHLPRRQHRRCQRRYRRHLGARPLPRLNVAEHPAFRVHLARDTGRLYVSRPIFAPPARPERDLADAGGSTIPTARSPG